MFNNWEKENGLFKVIIDCFLNPKVEYPTPKMVFPSKLDITDPISLESDGAFSFSMPEWNVLIVDKDLYKRK